MNPFDRLPAGNRMYFLQNGFNLKRQLLPPDRIRCRDKQVIIFIPEGFGGVGYPFADNFGPVDDHPPTPQFIC